MYHVDTNTMLGRTVTGIRMDEQILAFRFADGTHQCFEVEGDCCSTSYFYDVTGADKLLAGGPIIEFSEIPEYPQPPADQEGPYQECVKAYGIRIVSDHPVFGPVTTVVSFRNDSNGYYGGDMTTSDADYPDALTDITGDHYTTDA